MARRSGLRLLSRSSALLVLGIALGCGGERAPQATTGADFEPYEAVPPRPPNAAPTVRDVSLRPAEPVAGERVTAVVDAVDPDGDTLRFTYRWRLDGERSEVTAAVFPLPDRARGQRLEVEVIATDGAHETQPVGASAWVENQPPVIEKLVIEPGAEITVEQTLVASAHAVDPDGDPVETRYTWLVNDRPVEAPGRQLAAPAFRRGDRIRLQATASDGEDDSEPVTSPEIRVVNAVPRIVSSPAGFDESGSFHYTVQVQDPDRDRSLRFRLVQAPQGMNIDWLSGTVTWTPDASQTGDHDVVIEVDDQAGGVATQSFRLQVADQPAAKPAQAPVPAASES